MKKLMVLDGNSIVNRAFYGVSQNLTTRDGQPTNAVFGFLAILNKLLDECEPQALCVTFDRKAPTFRHLAYEGYKATRKGMPDELASQMPILKEVLAALNIPMYELDGWEADDLIGTISVKDTAAGWETVVVVRGQGLPPVGDRDHHRQAGVHPHGPHRHPGYDPGDLSGGVRLRPHPHYRPESPHGGCQRQHPRGERGGGKDGHGPGPAVWIHRPAVRGHAGD